MGVSGFIPYCWCRINLASLAKISRYCLIASRQRPPHQKQIYDLFAKLKPYQLGKFLTLASAVNQFSDGRPYVDAAADDVGKTPLDFPCSV